MRLSAHVPVSSEPLIVEKKQKQKKIIWFIYIYTDTCIYMSTWKNMYIVRSHAHEPFFCLLVVGRTPPTRQPNSLSPTRSTCLCYNEKYHRAFRFTSTYILRVSCVSVYSLDAASLFYIILTPFSSCKLPPVTALCHHSCQFVVSSSFRCWPHTDRYIYMFIIIRLYIH